jgi:hypothetical protein
MNSYRRTQNAAASDPGDNQRNSNNVSVDNLSVSRLNVDRVILNRDPGIRGGRENGVSDSNAGSRDDRHDGRRRHDDTDVLLDIATGGAGPLSAIPTVLTAPIPIVSLTLDGDKLRDVSALFNFSAIISLPMAVTVNLNFQMFRSLDNGMPVPIGPQFTFARTATILETDSFGFQLYDGQIDANTVTYSVVLAMSSTISASAAVTILNATLSALRVGNDR